MENNKSYQEALQKMREVREQTGDDYIEMRIVVDAARAYRRALISNEGVTMALTVLMGALDELEKDGSCACEATTKR